VKHGHEDFDHHDSTLPSKHSFDERRLIIANWTSIVAQAIRI
jgi:hypothetical protein